jgi:hypothetical protein
MIHFMALCRRCGASYDVDLEPALVCHVGDDDWELLRVQDHTLDDDLVDAWHDGVFDHKVELRDVIKARFRWNDVQFDNWVRTADPEDSSWPPAGAQPV